MLLLPLGHSLMKVKPVKLVSQDGDNMLSAMTLTHTGYKEQLRTLGCRTDLLCAPCSRQPGWLPTSLQASCHMPGSPGVVLAQPNQQALPTACLLQPIFKRERQITFLVGMESVAFLTMATGCSEKAGVWPSLRNAEMTAKGSRAVMIRRSVHA